MTAHAAITRRKKNGDYARTRARHEKPNYVKEPKGHESGNIEETRGNAMWNILLMLLGTSIHFRVSPSVVLITWPVAPRHTGARSFFASGASAAFTFLALLVMTA